MLTIKRIFQPFFLSWTAATARNPYTVLGLGKLATTEEIKAAYRNIAQKYHPDKNKSQQASTIFLQAKQAYQCLIKEQDRKQYQYDGPSQDPYDQFQGYVYKDKTRVHHQTFSSGPKQKRKRGQDLVVDVQINIFEAMRGGLKKIQLKKDMMCDKCHGNRCKPGSAPSRCMQCGGSGTSVTRGTSTLLYSQCKRCRGVGVVFKDACTSCSGLGIKAKNVEQEIEIKAGTGHGEKVTHYEMGNEGSNSQNGNLVIYFRIKPHPKFKLMGRDVHSYESLTLSQAALGCTKHIQTVWGLYETVISAGVQDGHHIVIPQYGAPSSRGKGDHVVIIKVKVPTGLTEKERKIFRELAQYESSPPQEYFTEEKPEKPEEQEKKKKVSAAAEFYDKFKNAFS